MEENWSVSLVWITNGVRAGESNSYQDLLLINWVGLKMLSSKILLWDETTISCNKDTFCDTLHFSSLNSPLLSGTCIRIKHTANLNIPVATGNMFGPFYSFLVVAYVDFKIQVIELNIQDTVRRRIAQELRINLSTQCHYIVVCYQCFYYNGVISIVLEYMDGGSLGDFLKLVKTIPEPYLAAICKQASV